MNWCDSSYWCEGKRCVFTSLLWRCKRKTSQGSIHLNAVNKIPLWLLLNTYIFAAGTCRIRCTLIAENTDFCPHWNPADHIWWYTSRVQVIVVGVSDRDLNFTFLPSFFRYKAVCFNFACLPPRSGMHNSIVVIIPSTNTLILLLLLSLRIFVSLMLCVWRFLVTAVPRASLLLRDYIFLWGWVTTYLCWFCPLL